MNCSEFDRWLDDGMPGSDAARAHAASCSGCAAQLRAAEKMEAAFTTLIRADVRAPERFTDVVMQRVARVEAVRPSYVEPPVRDPFPWWVRAAAEPSIAVALTLCALLLWQSPAILAAGTSAFTWLAQFTGAIFVGAARGVDPSANPLVTYALSLATFPAAWWLATVAYRWTDRVIQRATMPVPRRGR